MGRQAAGTRLGAKSLRLVRGRGGNIKHRALKVDSGNFTWGSEQVTRKTRILDVVYNATNNELVRTKTLVKNAIVQIDATPFKQWYSQHYDVELGKKKVAKDTGDDKAQVAAAEPAKKSRHVQAAHKKRQATRAIESIVAD